MLYFRLYLVNMTNVTHLLFLLHDNTERIMIQTYSNQSHKKKPVTMCPKHYKCQMSQNGRRLTGAAFTIYANQTSRKIGRVPENAFEHTCTLKCLYWLSSVALYVLKRSSQLL